MSTDTSTAPRVVLYGRAGCHLCDEARPVVERVCADTGQGFLEVDVDVDPVLVAAYGDLVPVVTVDGVKHGFWQIDADHLRDALTS
ncbi:glutaredoxin family protein [Luteimicrobium subarcticum]|uniref:Glutaredoxin-like protein DUF836 n=1 Tax=Luteimicrobium subarcticum TaxID=620910 RepID=A0A2M8WVS6_9MICO|nr:glutaredoxin family protein [Luteimicrobium subarcticum]PJI95022.1 glutaredoxin-like protein DUF836 [Luteimicrobium subarcticum]